MTTEAVVTYPRDAVLDERQIADALGISIAKVKKADLPTIYFGREKRFLWGSVLDVLKEREEK